MLERSPSYSTLFLTALSRYCRCVQSRSSYTVHSPLFSVGLSRLACLDQTAAVLVCNGERNLSPLPHTMYADQGLLSALQSKMVAIQSKDASLDDSTYLCDSSSLLSSHIVLSISSYVHTTLSLFRPVPQEVWVLSKRKLWPTLPLLWLQPMCRLCHGRSLDD